MSNPNYKKQTLDVEFKIGDQSKTELHQDFDSVWYLVQSLKGLDSLINVRYCFFHFKSMGPRID